MHKYRELNVWQRGMALTIRLYRETSGWPVDERYGLISQVRRAVSSIPMNIAEGAGNSSQREFCRFLEISMRSDYELMTAIDSARGLAYVPDEHADALIKEADEIAAMLTGLMKSLGGPYNR
jgi:four helix bundle protein